MHFEIRPVASRVRIGTDSDPAPLPPTHAGPTAPAGPRPRPRPRESASGVGRQGGAAARRQGELRLYKKCFLL
jgi:hypothetical protein